VSLGRCRQWPNRRTKNPTGFSRGSVKAPLSPEEIEWKVIASKGGQTTLAPYIDARAVMARLDRAFGPFGWKVSYATAQVGNEHGVIASIAIKNPETGEGYDPLNLKASS